MSTCSAFTSGEWTVTKSLDTARHSHISWLSPLGIVLIGGESYIAASVINNAELLSNGTILFTFDTDTPRSHTNACGIGLMDTVVVTGGGIVYIKSTVVVYNTIGMVEQLPDLRTPRRDHACGHYVDSNNHVVSLCHRQPACIQCTYKVENSDIFSGLFSNGRTHALCA